MKKKILFLKPAVRLLTFLCLLVCFPLTSYASQLIHTIQTGSFINEEDAQKHYDSIVQGSDKKYLENLRIEKVGKYYSVRIGKFENLLMAEKILKEINPQLSASLIMTAYMKDKRIKKMYRGYLSFDEPDKTVLAKNERPVQQTETDMYPPENTKRSDTHADDYRNTEVKDEDQLTSDASRLIHTIQTGSFINEEDAQKHYDSIMQGSDKKYLENLRIEKVGKYYSVRIGKFENLLMAEKILKDLNPQLSASLIMTAYMKDKRIKKIYRGYLSFDEPDKTVIAKNEKPVNPIEKDLKSPDVSSVAQQKRKLLYQAKQKKTVLAKNKKPVQQRETKIAPSDNENIRDAYANNSGNVLVNNERQLQETVAKGINPVGIDFENEDNEYQYADTEFVPGDDEYALLDLDNMDTDAGGEEYQFPEIESEFSAFAGYRFLELSGAEKVFEYEYLEHYPIAGLELRTFNYPYMLHFDLDFKNEKDFATDLRLNYKSSLVFQTYNSTVFHNLGNIELLDLDTTNGLTNRVTDLDGDRKFDVTRGMNRIKLGYSDPRFPMHAFVQGFYVTRKGAQQQRSLRGTGYHTNIERITQGRDIDWTTSTTTVGANSHLGPIEAEFTHELKTFDVGKDPVLYDDYAGAGGRVAGRYPHNLVPEFKSSSNKIRLHTSFTGQLVASASISKKDGENRDSGATTDILDAAGAVTWTPLTNLAFFLRYSHRELDREHKDTTSITAIDNGTTKTYADLRPSISSTTDSVNLTARYKPVKKLTLKARYKYKEKERSNTTTDSSISTLWHFTDPVTRKRDYSFFVTTQYIKNMDIKGEYTRTEASDPAYNIEPNSANKGKLSISWLPSAMTNFFLSYSMIKENRNGLNYVDTAEPKARDVTKDNLLASGTFNIMHNLALTASYAYMNYEIIQDLENHDSSGNALTDYTIPWEETTDVYSASLNYWPTETLRFLGEINYVKSSSMWSPVDPNMTQPVSLASFSEQKITETVYRLSSDYTCIHNGSCIVEFKYADFDDVLENIHDDNMDGDAYMILMKLTKKWG